MSDYTREDLDQDTKFARDRWEARTGKDGSFDRWLTEVEREAAAEAWEAGAEAVKLVVKSGDCTRLQYAKQIPRNPYRATEI